MSPSTGTTSSPGWAATVPTAAIRPPSTATSPGQRAPRSTTLVIAVLGHRAVDRLLDDIEQAQVGDLGDLDQGGGLLGGGGVLQPGVAGAQDRLLGVLAHGHHQREAELLPVGVVEGVEGAVLVAAEPVQAGDRLVDHRLGGQPALAGGHPGQVRVLADELQLALGRGLEEHVVEGLAQVVDVLEGPGGIGLLGDPGWPLEQRPEGLHELGPVHLVDLVDGEDLVALGDRQDLGDQVAPAPPDVEDQVEDDGADAAQGDAAGDDGLHRLGEVGHDRRVDGRGHGEAEADGQDDHVALVVEVDPAHGLDADHGHGPEQGEAGPAEHRRRDRGHDGPDLGDQADEDHEQPGGGDHPAALDLGQPDQPDVLGEAGVGEGVEDAAQGGGQAVGPQGPGHVLLVHRLVHDLAGGEHVAGGLDHGDQHDDDHRDDRGHVEGGGAEVEGGGDAEHVGPRDSAEVGEVEDPAGQGADQQPDEHRDGGHEAAEGAVDAQDDQQGEAGQGQVAELAEGRRVAEHAGPAAAGGLGGHRQQHDADDGDDGAGHHRREQPDEAGEEGRDQEGEDP